MFPGASSNINLYNNPSEGFSQTLVNSQQELRLNEGIISGGNLEFERVIRSAAHKYRHMQPSRDAIQEENENQAATPFQRINAQHSQLQSLFFKRNQYQIDEEGEGLQNMSSSHIDYFPQTTKTGMSGNNLIYSGMSQPSAAL